MRPSLALSESVPLTPLTAVPLFALSPLPENLPHSPASSHSVTVSPIICDTIHFVPFLICLL